MRITVLALVLCLASHSFAKTLVSANNGVDSVACGVSDSPCRSISRAIANAAAGDTIVVGPGYYGDLNQDGAYDDAGDEAGTPASGCLCVINVNKRVTLKSRDGADATFIDGGSVSRAIYF